MQKENALQVIYSGYNLVLIDWVQKEAKSILKNRVQ